MNEQLGQRIIERELPHPLTIPAPLLQRWAHLQVIKEGCPFCGNKRVELLRSNTGPTRFENETERGGREVLSMLAQWEEMVCRCGSCGEEFTFRFMSPERAQQPYRKIIRLYLQDFVEFFTEETTAEEPSFNREEILGFFDEFLEALFLEEDVKNLPFSQYLKVELSRFTEDLTRRVRTSETEEERLKAYKQFNFVLSFFAVFSISQLLEENTE